MKVSNIYNQFFSFSGRKALKTIMDSHTPNMDLLVRESVQNSCDARKDGSRYTEIDFQTGQFSNANLSSQIETVGPLLLAKYKTDNCSFLAIGDKHTTGLLGAPKKSLNGEPNNLYKLVYSIMEDKDSSDSGGSWGIGKTVYFRFGTGICFYYSRTFENGQYLTKLAGTLIEDETADDRLSSGQDGICFFGNSSNDNEAAPIMDEKEINNFLSIFGINPYKEAETGTIVIIPYLREQDLLSGSINDEQPFWRNNFEQSLSVSLQRWYFPKLYSKANDRFSLICRINGNIVSLNPFFINLQKLYLGKFEGQETFEVIDERISKTPLGTLNYKLFSKAELGVQTAPENLPSPYVYLDMEEGSADKEREILFYTRKAGMIITYDNSKFGSFEFEKGKFLIGVFVLNDSCTENNELLGSYFRGTEAANHKEWVDSNLKEFPYFKELKPFAKICKKIRNKLSSEFSASPIPETESTNNALQKRLGQMLLPPEDFGKEPGSTQETPPVLPKTHHKRTYSFYFNGFDKSALSYCLSVCLKPSQKLECKLLISAEAKDFLIEDWLKMGFKMPCDLCKLVLKDYSIQKSTIPLNTCICEKEELLKRRAIKGPTPDSHLLAFGTDHFEKETIIGFYVENPGSEEISADFELYFKPIDLSYSINFQFKCNMEDDK
jgi:hypothetical protein